MVEVAEQGADGGEHQQERLVACADGDDADYRANTVAEYERRFATNTIGQEPGRDGGDGPCDETDEQSQSDKTDVEPDGKQVQIEEDVERAVDHVHADDMDYVQVGVTAEFPGFADVLGIVSVWR